MNDTELRHIVRKTQDAKRGGWGVQGNGEKLASMDYTMAEAIDHVGPEWVALIPTAAKLVAELELDVDAEG